VRDEDEDEDEDKEEDEDEDENEEEEDECNSFHFCVLSFHRFPVLLFTFEPLLLLLSRTSVRKSR
jgi:hypothetical protein